MEKHVRFFLASILVLLAPGICLQVSAQPEVITEVPVNSENFVTIGNLVYFNAGDDLWRTDGTDEGTIFLKSGIRIGQRTTEFNGMAIFKIPDTKDLWRSDGTPEGTILLKTFGSHVVEFIGRTPNFLFIRGYEVETGLELYRTDGSVSGTILVKDIRPGVNSGLLGVGAATIGSQLFFVGNDGTTGAELWKTDGTPGGTALVKDIYSGPESGVNSNSFLAFNDLIFFAGHTLDHGSEPWISDGTADGTHLLKDIVPGRDMPNRLDYRIAHNGMVYFLVDFVDDYVTTELWSSDGTMESTGKIKTVGDDAEFHSFIVYKDKVGFFSQWGHSEEALWITDGTTEGTEIIFSHTTGGANVHYFDVVNSHILFTGSAEGHPTPFFRSDGTAAGTEEFARFKAYFDSYVVIERIGVTTVGDFAFFADHDGPVDEGGNPDDGLDYYHLFQTDGFKTQSIRLLLVTPVGVDNITDFNGQVVYTTYDDQRVGTGSEKLLWIYDPASLPATPASLTLVNADTNEDIQTLHEDDTVYLPENLNVNIRFNPAYTPESVRFVINGGNVRTEFEPPYALAGDKNGDYNTWEAGSGSFHVVAWPNYIVNGERVIGAPTDLAFNIIREPVSVECMASGTILRESWENVRGSRVSDIPLQTAPTSTSQLSIFESPTNAGTNYGARVNGYICPPTTGDYIFWIASNDHSELWLSTDDEPGNIVRIAYVEGATTARQWTKFPSQKSAAISLTAGQRYYIEALHKQGAGTDNLAVGWQLPDGTLERPIAGSRLSPYAGSSSNTPPVVSLTSPEEGQSFTEPATVLIEADASDDDGSIAKVEFYEGANKLGEDLTAPYEFTWNDVPAGTYNLRTVATDNEGSTADSEPINITVQEPGCMASGTITREYWGSVQGSQVSDVPVNSPPTSVSELTIFEGPSNAGVHYGSRIRGYICPPETGDYIFYISSNDQSELWLSTNADPANKVRIAWVTGATGERQWNKIGSQQSLPVMLTQGETYYIEAIHKQGVGSDHLAVGWQIPGGTFERPIPGSRLSPFEMNDAARMASGVEDESGKETMYSQIGIYPNPVERGSAALTISGYEGITETVETQVEIISLTGEVVYAERIRCGDDCGTYVMKINEQLVPGVYMVNMKTNGTRFSKRLLVK